jgi:hypothetical protein
MRNTADVTGGKPIAVLLQSISGLSAINPLVAFYDIHGGKRKVLFFHLIIFISLNRSLRLIVGTNHWNHGGQQYSVTSNMTHHQYSPILVKNDIALLYTSAAILYGNLVKPVPISFDHIGGGTIGVSAGWGQTWVSKHKAQFRLTQILLKLFLWFFDMFISHL